VGLEAAHRKWPTGSYLLWYPIKGRRDPDALARRLQRAGVPRILRAELYVADTPEEGPLGGCGLIVVNPPWTLESELAALLPALANVLATEGSGSHRIDWIGGER
jgi:23S rRNA (adenine2030-N6)-methyltransferase